METRKISLSAINAEDTRYQVRDSRACTYGEKIQQENNSKHHIKTIVKALNADPVPRIEHIEVIEDPSNLGRYIIVDGFHRYGAFSIINANTKGKRFKQIRVNVYTEGVPRDKALSINTEHTGLPLSMGQRTEMQWQQFLNLAETQPELSIKKTAELLGTGTTTISNWRKNHKEFIEEGFFKKNSNIDRNAITGYPMLKPCRDELQNSEWSTAKEETDGALTEADKATLSLILQKAQRAVEPEKLLTLVNHFWGNPHNVVDYDTIVDDIDVDDF